MKTAKLFKNGEGQAVQLPHEFHFSDDEVFIKRTGAAVILLPKSRPWKTLIESLDKFPDDFMTDRQQPRHEENREDFEQGPSGVK